MIAVLDLLATVLSGGATGILGSVVTGAFGFLRSRGERAEREAERAHELALHRLSMESGARETEAELEIAREESRGAALVASYQHDAGGGESRWVRNVLRLVRPALTLVLIALTGWLYHTLSGAIAADAWEIRTYIVHTVIYTCSASTLWWFADRGLRPPGVAPRA